MTNGKVILAMALIVAGSLVVSLIVGAFAGGIAGYLVARWEARGPSPEEWGEMPFPEPLPLPPFKFEEPLEGALVTNVEPREKITLTLSRGGESREIRVTLGETRNEGKAIPYLGIHYRSIKGQGFFQPQRFDLGRLPQPKLIHLFRRFLRQIPLPLPTM